MRTLVLLGYICVLIACGNGGKETNQVIKAVDDAAEVVKDLPKIKKEIEVFKTKLNTQELTGTFYSLIDGDELTITSWNSAKSRITFIDGKAIFNLYSKDTSDEHLFIQLNATDLYDASIEKDFTPTMYPIHLLEGDFNQKNSDMYIQITYKNEITRDEYHSGKGTIRLEKLTNSELQIRYKGQGMKGDWKAQQYVPLTIKINLSYNFLTNNIRTN